MTRELNVKMAAIPLIKMLFSLPGLIAIMVVFGFILHLAGVNLLTIFATAAFIALILFIVKRVFR